MISVVILGTGNVAKHLFDVFLTKSNIKVLQVYGRNQDKLANFNKQVDTTSEMSNLKEADVYLMAISDDAISKVSKSLGVLRGLIVHTSGSVALKTISKKNSRGVFYPLQTFSSNRKVDFKEIPICIEAENELDYKLLNDLASTISNKVTIVNTDQRKSLHLSAVFANNFTNHIYYTAQEICEKNNVSFDLLIPLIKETSAKVHDISPFDAQTGPARRNDKGTIKKHKKQLKTKNRKKIYSLLSKSIGKTYGKKL